MKKHARWILIFIVSLHTVGIIAGCSFRHQPKAYISIEKQPVKVTYIDYHRDISPSTVDMLMTKVSAVPFRAAQLNKENAVIISYDAEAIHSTTDNKTWEIK